MEGLYLQIKIQRLKDDIDMAEIKRDKSKRELTLERMGKRYPDKSFDDDEALFGQINDDYDQYDQKLAKNDEQQRAFSDMFHSNPKSARLMMEWKDGKDPVASLIRIYGKEDILAAIDDPDRLEAIEEANKEFAERVAKNDEYEAAYEKNFPASVSAIESWMAESGRSEEEVDGALETLSKICGDFIMGKFTPETVEMLLKARNYESDIEQAQYEGEVAGRNSKIEERLRRGSRGDGTVTLDGRGTGSGRGQRGLDLGALDRYGESKSIFERGGEKRITRR